MRTFCWYYVTCVCKYIITNPSLKKGGVLGFEVQYLGFHNCLPVWYSAELLEIDKVEGPSRPDGPGPYTEGQECLMSGVRPVLGHRYYWTLYGSVLGPNESRAFCNCHFNYSTYVDFPRATSSRTHPIVAEKAPDSVRRVELNFGLMRPVITDHFSFRFPYQWRTCPVAGSCQSLLITATLTAHRSFPLMNEIAIGSLKYSFKCFTGRCPIISPTTDHL